MACLQPDVKNALKFYSLQQRLLLLLLLLLLLVFGQPTCNDLIHDSNSDSNYNFSSN